MLHGEQNSAKSTLQELIRVLADPSAVLTLAFPRDINELVQRLDFGMTKFLWTGESEYCTCGHHVTDHETWQSFIAIATQQPATTTVTCRGGNKVGIIQGCHCDEFRPYRNRILDEDYNEVIEKQYPEVNTKQNE